MTNHRSRRALLCATALLCLAAPAQAFATNAEVVNGELRVTAVPGEGNYGGVDLNSAGEISFFDNEKDMTAGNGCRVENRDPVPDGAVCPAQGVDRITVALGDRNDSFYIQARVPAVSFSGGTGTDTLGYAGDPSLGATTITLDDVANDGRDGRDNIASDVEGIAGSNADGDVLTGGTKPVTIDGFDGDDTVTGGTAGDYITAAYVSESGEDLGQRYNQGKDRIDCGDGNDTVFADKGDTIADDCEVVGLPTGREAEYRFTGSRGADNIVVKQYVSAIINAGAGNDKVRFRGAQDGTIAGGAGNDDLKGTSSQDSFSGGKGKDLIDARRGSRDKVSCGSGRDRVLADKRDKVARDCERVSRRK